MQLPRLISCSKYIVFGVILFRLWYALYFLVYGNDTFSQQFAADQLLAGHGLTHPVMDSVRPESVIYQPMAKWPPTLTFLQAMLYALIHDWIIVSQILTVVSVIIFSCMVYKTMQLLRFSNTTQLVSWVIILTNPLLFQDFGVSDWLGLSAFSGGFYLLSSFILNPQKSYRWIVMAALGFYLPAFFRYQYYPLVAMLPLAALYWSFKSANHLLVRKVWVLCFFTASFLFLQIGLFQWYSGGMGYPFSNEQGWYWSNLLQTDSFLIKSFFRADYFLYKVPEFTEIIRTAFQLLSLVLFFWVVVLLFNKRKKLSLSQDSIIFLQRIILFFTGAYFMFLSVLSIRNPPVAFGFMNLNFVGETRYYSPVMYLLMLLFVFLFQEYRKRFAWLAASAFILICNILLWIKFLFNIPQLPAPVTALRWAVSDRAVVKQVLQKAIPATDMPVVLSWLPTEYILLNTIYRPTYILRNYQLLFSQDLSDKCHYVFASELTFLKQNDRTLLSHKGFQEVYNDGFYFVCLRKAAMK